MPIMQSKDLLEVDELDTQKDQYFTFSIGTEYYGIEIKNITRYRDTEHHPGA
jgi:chemotaxis signal transduction protein